MKKSFPTLVFFIIALLFSSLTFAKEINLYEQPKADAKVLGKVDLTAGIIPIYTPDQSEWVKVADPRNGNVGWVKTTDLNSAGTAVTFTQKFFGGDKGGAQSYQMFNYGQPQKMTPQQVQDTMQKMQIQQRALEESLQNAVQQMMDQINKLSGGTLNVKPSNYPLIMPIVIVPQQKETKPTQTTPTTAPAKTQFALPLKSPDKTQ